MTGKRSIHEWHKCTHDTDNPRFPRCVLTRPRKVTRLKTEGTVFGVSTTSTNRVDPLGAELGAGWLTTELEFSLLAVVRALSTRVRTFVPGRAGDTCIPNS